MESFVIEVASEDNERKPQLLHKYVCAYMPIEGFGAKVLFYYLREKLPLSNKKNSVILEGVVSHTVAHSQLSFLMLIIKEQH